MGKEKTAGRRSLDDTRRQLIRKLREIDSGAYRAGVAAELADVERRRALRDLRGPLGAAGVRLVMQMLDAADGKPGARDRLREYLRAAGISADDVRALVPDLEEPTDTVARLTGENGNASGDRSTASATDSSADPAGEGEVVAGSPASPAEDLPDPINDPAVIAAWNQFERDARAAERLHGQQPHGQQPA